MSSELSGCLRSRTLLMCREKEKKDVASVEWVIKTSCQLKSSPGCSCLWEVGADSRARTERWFIWGEGGMTRKEGQLVGGACSLQKPGGTGVNPSGKTSGSCRLCLRTMPGCSRSNCPQRRSKATPYSWEPRCGTWTPSKRKPQAQSGGAHRVHLSCGCGR